ncbi:MAG: NUDIX domain-containing protein [Puniceicoccales bacterium]|nr:NUDIX domain-containing protein [Puniceicoccales bacterium]
MELRRSAIVRIFILLLPLALWPRGLWAAREDGINKIEVFVSCYCYRINRVRGPEILLLKRAAHRALHPNLWECGGGSVHENENFEDAGKRQLLEETGLAATRWKTLECFEVEVRPGVIVPGLAFTCKAKPDAQVKIDPREHSDYRWVTINELEDMILVGQKMRRSIVKLLIIQDKFF